MSRAFVALPVPAPAAARLAAQAQGVPVGRPVPAENMHLTLAFLGEQPEHRLQALHGRLDEIEARALTVRLLGVEIMGNETRGAIVRVAAPDPALLSLQKSVERAARAAGIALPRRRFRPHVTIARFSRAPVGTQAEALHRWLASGPPAPVEFPAEAFALFESHLRLEGARYIELARYPLVGPAAPASR